jgi:hypothetical protein
VTATALASTGIKPSSVSYSESSSYLLCQRKWEYGYGRSLQRITESSSLLLGSAGHSILQAFYEVILAAGDTKALQLAAFDAALSRARERYDEIVKDGFTDDERKEPLERIMFEFYFPNEPFVKNGWQILAVEREFALDTIVDDETGETIRTPFIIDLIAYDPDGKIVVIDHKFVYDFYTYEDAQLQPQIPLYIGGLQALNYKVAYGYYNMVRNRKIGGEKMLKAQMVEALINHYGQDEDAGAMAAWEKDLPKMKVNELEGLCEVQKIITQQPVPIDKRLSGLELKPSPKRVQRTFLEQLDTAREITPLKTLDPEVRDLKMHRVANKMVCQSCSFRDLCITELSGGNVALMLRTEYKQRERRALLVDESTENE